MLSGYCRLSYSLLVMLLETTQAINLFIPMLICMMTSYATAQVFNQSLYNRALRGKQVPMLMNRIPKQNVNLRASIIMKLDPITIRLVSSVKDLAEAMAHGYR